MAPARSSEFPLIQGVICTWRGHEQRAMALEQKLRDLVPITVINTEPSARHHSHWVHLDESAFFAEQWNCLVSRFTGDVLFQVQADADSDDFPAIFARARTLFARHRMGVYEPNVFYTDICYTPSRLQFVEPGLAEVPWTDCTCWFIHRCVISQCPRFDLNVNTFGWGICRTMAACCALQGRFCVRDYSCFVKHPKGRGYPAGVALQQLRRYVDTLPQDIRAEIGRLEQARAALRV